MKPALLTLGLLFASMIQAAPLTPNELHATMGIITNFILSDDDIRFHGKSYKPVTSPHTGRVWLDRNIGASKVCTSYDYPLCYGDLFQWGRKHDGHESSIDSTPVQASNINSAGAEFIRGSTDWADTDTSYGNARATNWLKTDGSSVCPVGYRVPLRSELDAEVGDISNKETAYTNFLKFPAAGYRDYGSADFYDVGMWGTVWSVSSSENRASYFRFWNTSNWNDSGARAWGLSVRCIKHTGEYIRDDAKEVVTQLGARLMWQDNLVAETVTKKWLTNAINFDCTYTGNNCENTSGNTATTYCTNLVLGGYDDWRLPSQEELFGIVESSVSSPNISAVFQHTASNYYWSSTTHSSYNNYAGVVYFGDGLSYSSYIKNSNAYVRCVRAGQ